MSTQIFKLQAPSVGGEHGTYFYQGKERVYLLTSDGQLYCPRCLPNHYDDHGLRECRCNTMFEYKV